MVQRLFVLTAAAMAALTGPALAQSRVHTSHGAWVSQYDRPGDYRCDAYWDAGQRDCDAGWRDQRRYSSRGARGPADHAGRHPDGHAHHRYGPHGQDGAPAVYPGAWGRPDLVYPGTARVDPRRDGGRIAWCEARYRSYDPHSGHYRTWDGRRVFCG